MKPTPLSPNGGQPLAALLGGLSARLTGVEVGLAIEILLWLSPVLIPVLAVALFLAVPPLVVGAATAVLVVGGRLAQLLVRRPESTVGESGTAPSADPWAQLVELSETNGGETAATSGGAR